jgi:hypothetical protein
MTGSFSLLGVSILLAISIHFIWFQSAYNGYPISEQAGIPVAA